MRKKIPGLLLLLFSIMVIQGCSTTPLTPSQTAQHFWSAMLAKDSENATRYATDASLPTIRDAGKDFNDAAVSFGKVSIQSDQATVETSLKYPSPDNGDTTTFITYLDREKEYWRVNFLETRKSLDKAREKRGLNKLVEDLNKLGRNFSGQLGEALKHWEEAGPELKKDLENLGESLQKDLQGSMDKYGPEIQRNLQEFTESLEEAMKELQKNKPEEKQPEQAPDPKPRMI